MGQPGFVLIRFACGFAFSKDYDRDIQILISWLMVWQSVPGAGNMLFEIAVDCGAKIGLRMITSLLQSANIMEEYECPKQPCSKLIFRD